MQPRTLPSVDRSPMMKRQEAADYLNVSVRTIDRMIAAGLLPFRRVGKRSIRIYRTAVEIKEA